MNLEQQQIQLERFGWTTIDNVLTPSECESWAQLLDRRLLQDDQIDGPLRSGESVYGARNLLDYFPERSSPCPACPSLSSARPF